MNSPYQLSSTLLHYAQNDYPLKVDIFILFHIIFNCHVYFLTLNKKYKFIDQSEMLPEVVEYAGICFLTADLAISDGG